MRKMKILYFLLTLFLLAGCITEQKQRQRAEEFYRVHAEELAVKCADKFVVHTEIVQGKTIRMTDTIFVAVDSVICPTLVVADKPFKVKCPDSKIIYIANDRVDTLKVENTAKVNALTFANNRLNADIMLINKKLNEVEQVARNRLKLLLLFILILALLVWMRIRKI